MITRILKIDRSKFHKRDLMEAAAILRAGELVAFPTETVYGLGGNALDASAASRIYEAKGRPSDNPLIVHIAEISALEQIAEDVPEEAYRLAGAFWPGPLTMIFKKSSLIPSATTGGLETVAVRMPSDEIALSLIRESGIFIAAPSANASGRPSTTMAEHVIEDLDGKIAMILDGGPVTMGLESTIIDLSSGKPLILRPGFIAIEQLIQYIPEIEYDKGLFQQIQNEKIIAKAPGMKYRHYAPKGELTIYEGRPEDVTAAIQNMAAEKLLLGEKVGILTSDESMSQYTIGIIKSVGTRKDPAQIASKLFTILREFDYSDVSIILAESFDEDRIGQAIMNRLRKAAGYRIVKVSK